MPSSNNKKRSPTAYNFLVKDQTLRQTIKKENPDWTHPQVMAEFSRLWKSYTPEEKQPYVDQAARAKAEFQPSTDTNTDTTTNSNAQPSFTEKPKRAKTPFFHYLYDPNIRDPVKSTNPNLKGSEITKIISEQWSKLSPEEKQPWEQKHLQEKQELIDNPQMVQKKVKNTKSSTTSTTTTSSQDLRRLENLEQSHTQLSTKLEQLLNLVKSLQTNQDNQDEEADNEDDDSYFSDED